MNTSENVLAIKDNFKAPKNHSSLAMSPDKKVLEK